MKPAQLVHTLQLVDSFFPVGAFAYSDGLETASAGGLLRRPDSPACWLDHFLNRVFVPCDGLAVLKCARAMRAHDWDAVRSIDDELTALKPAAAVRASSSAIGKRLLNMYVSIFDPELSAPIETLPRSNAPVAYGIALSRLGLDARDCVLAYGYGRLAGIVSAALRLLPIGQQRGQELLTRTLYRLPDAAESILEHENEPLRSFGPLLDIQQMNHHKVYSRLFRS